MPVGWVLLYGSYVSHGIHQKRTEDCVLKVLFSQIVPWSLDYHKTFGELPDAKKRLFDRLSKSIRITNIDDKNGLVMLQNTAAESILCI